jgi:hypothetical protein
VDAVYIVRPGDSNEELRYSLRSIQKHLPFIDRVFVSGWFPDFLNPETVIHIASYDTALPADPRSSRHRKGYQDAEANWQAACLDERVSETFLAMNDDFFVMQPVQEMPMLHDGEIDAATARRVGNFGVSHFTRALKNTRDFILKNELAAGPVLSYALHVPMVMEKRLKVSELVAPDLQNGVVLLSRTIYGNMFAVGGEYYEDAKVAGWITEAPEDAIFLSTNENSFANGTIGEIIREAFPERSKYEKDH